MTGPYLGTAVAATVVLTGAYLLALVWDPSGWAMTFVLVLAAVAAGAVVRRDARRLL